eukprot:CAMPEP_0195296368 /NCGR_PEP_ID=MMETSP0707-20130614/19286_1 /TAXON_ID=33640 /ORGANISM="Asterionellopsis glacialis, Strain CCMP134" /LENGTH=264 /DNA_ID=CAMNT_0040357851 /DNA_START=78 /DNA_END=872 /DNA_ORIENTATION=-
MGNEASAAMTVASAKGKADKFLTDAAEGFGNKEQQINDQPVKRREMQIRHQERQADFEERKREREERKAKLQSRWNASKEQNKSPTSEGGGVGTAALNTFTSWAAGTNAATVAGTGDNKTGTSTDADTTTTPKKEPDTSWAVDDNQEEEEQQQQEPSTPSSMDRLKELKASAPPSADKKSGKEKKKKNRWGRKSKSKSKAETPPPPTTVAAATATGNTKKGEADTSWAVDEPTDSVQEAAVTAIESKKDETIDGAGGNDKEWWK